jgi:hypothetical protein
MAYKSLLSHWRFAPVGDPWFTGDRSKYWAERMAQLRDAPGGDAAHVSASKTIGWK